MGWNRVILLLLVCAHWSTAVVTKADDAAYSFPPEWARQDAVWIGWPQFSGDAGTPDGDFDRSIAAVRAQMITELLSGSRVTLLVASDTAEKEARDYLTDAGISLTKINFHRAPLDDYFVRDIGPRFISNGQSLKIADIPWNCYGFSKEMSGSYHQECLDREVNDNAVAQQMGVQTVTSKAISEGGGLDVTNTLLMGYLDTALSRNPGMSQAEIEADYLATYGKKKMIWLKKPPLADRTGHKVGRYFGWGANGHVDEYARFVNDSTVVIAQIDEKQATNALARADQKILASNLADLKAARTVDGKPLTIVEMPAADPAMFAYEIRLRDAPYLPQSWADLSEDYGLDDPILFAPAVSYMNFVITNDKVLVAKYWREGLPDSVRADDKRAADTLARLFPNRQVVAINPLPLNWFGGGMHCSTQQQPIVNNLAL